MSSIPVAMAFKIEVALGILMAGLQFAQQADRTLAEGVALLQSGDAVAPSCVEAVTSREPWNGRARATLESPINRPRIRKARLPPSSQPGGAAGDAGPDL